MSSPLDLWLEERDKGHSRRFKVKRTLFSEKSDFQQVDVVETETLGRMLLLDGLVMCSEKDEFIYPEMISHVPLFIHPEPKRVLIIGGGDGGTAREVLRHKSIEHCTMVEIDGMVVDACKQHIPSIAKALNEPDSRFELIIGDGIDYINKTKDKFDVIIVDSTDPLDFAAPLFGDSFYDRVAAVLKDQGIVTAQAESPFFHADHQKTLLKRLADRFSVHRVYNYFNLTYPGALWGFAYGSNGQCPWEDFDEKRVTESGLTFQYYNPVIHKAAFALPQFQKNLLAGYLSPLQS